MDFKQFYYDLFFDINKSVTRMYTAKQGDTKARGFYVTILQDSVVVPVTTQTMTFYAEKPDKTRIFVDAVKDGDKFRVDLTNQVFAVPGKVRCELTLRGATGEQISSKTFAMLVDASIQDGSIVSADERGVLDRAFELAVDIVPRLEGLDVPLLENVDSEITLARGTEPTLGARLDADKLEVSTQLADIADSVYTNSAYIVGTSPININFADSYIEFPNTIDIFYSDIRKKFSNQAPVNIPKTTYSRKLLVFDTETNDFSVLDGTTRNPKNTELLLGTIRVVSRQALINGEFTVDGKPALSDGKALILEEPISDIFYRYATPVITDTTITFPSTIKIYKYGENLGKYKKVYGYSPEISFEWNHNTNIVWDFTDNTLKRVVYPDTIENSVVLFKNIDGKLVGGVLKQQYDGDMMIVPVSSDNKTYKSVGKVINKTDTTRSGTPNGSAVVGDEYWAFNASYDDNTNYADCHRWLIDESTYALTHVGSFSHNWGHVNSADYCSETDTFICGNGSGTYVLSGKIFIFENASSFKTMSQVPLNDNALIIDVGMTYGAKVNVVWGSDNDGRYDIAHIITNDNKNVTRIQLGKGAVNLGLGNFISGKVDSQFNGSYKVLKTWHQSDGGDVVQGADYGDDGCLYVGLGHKGSWYTKQYLNQDGTIKGEVSKTVYINADGSENTGYSGSISLYKDKVLIRVLKDGKQWVHVVDK